MEVALCDEMILNYASMYFKLLFDVYLPSIQLDILLYNAPDWVEVFIK